MDYYVGSGLSLKQIVVCVLGEDGRSVMERSVTSYPDDIGACLADLAGTIMRIGSEAEPLASWLNSSLAERGLPVFCIEVAR